MKTLAALLVVAHWAGFEIMGNRHIETAKIAKLIPIRIGAPYEQDIPAWKSWCAEIRKALGVPFAECTATRFSDGNAYFTVDIVEKGDEAHAVFRPEPAGSLPLPPPEVMSRYDALQTRLWKLFNEGTPPGETWSAGYLDYTDPEMHRLVLELVKSVPPYRAGIIAALAGERDFNRRMTAADLLNWAGEGADSVAKVHTLLDDPHSAVRNQLSRFMMHFVASVKDPRVLDAVVDSLVTQLDRPSHGDRNKALFNLVFLVKAHPEEAVRIREKAGPSLRYIAARSILPNVGPVAGELMKLIGMATEP